MMKRNLGWMLMGVTSLACSGRYDVGEMNATAGAGSSSGATGGAASAGAVNGPTAGTAMTQPGEGGPTSTTPPDIAADCLSATAPVPLNGPFATPAVIFHRVATLTADDEATIDPTLPDATTYEWAGSLVPTALALLEPGSAPGVDALLREWLRLEPETTLEAPWGSLLTVQRPALQVLLWTTPVPKRTGIFSEASWLAQYDGISKRGAQIERALFGNEPPPPPPGIQNPDADPTLSDRDALAQQLSSPICAACHHIVDASGFALGHFDAVGDYRELDHGPIDTSGSRFVSSGTGEIVFDGIADFGQKFANSCDATLGFSDSFLRAALVVNEPSAARRDELFQASRDRVQQGFISGGRTYQAWVTAYIQSPAGIRP